METAKTSAASQSIMDGEHRIQMRLIVALEQALARGFPEDEVSTILDRLTQYSNIHFMSEQLLMRLHSYPDQGCHEDAHDELIEQLQRVRQSVGSQPPSPSSANILLLKQWLLNHIRSHDRAFELFLEMSDP
ncbi:putative Hemerythrin-like metal-binding protein [Candidatus Terasakiella magnetica]|nr:putative Hemerythrin-like metal-binding protein [Candidatus Terasakiella magnetica]